MQPIDKAKQWAIYKVGWGEMDAVIDTVLIPKKQKKDMKGFFVSLN